MRNANIACLVLLLTAAAVARGQTSSPSGVTGALVDVDGGKLYYEECGSGDGVVVLLHDGAANSAVWDDVWPAFCKRFHAIRYDRRGYGRSPATTKPYYEADDLAALLRARKVTWIGRAPRDPDPVKRWLTFLRNHCEAIAAMDFFNVPRVD